MRKNVSQARKIVPPRPIDSFEAIGAANALFSVKYRSLWSQIAERVTGRTIDCHFVELPRDLTSRADPSPEKDVCKPLIINALGSGPLFRQERRLEG